MRATSSTRIRHRLDHFFRAVGVHLSVVAGTAIGLSFSLCCCSSVVCRALCRAHLRFRRKDAHRTTTPAHSGLNLCARPCPWQRIDHKCQRYMPARIQSDVTSRHIPLIMRTLIRLASSFSLVLFEIDTIVPANVKRASETVKPHRTCDMHL